MGYLLKEALKTLCGVNQWSYAVFWKFGCQNPKLLIWEDYYIELASCSGHPGNDTLENDYNSSWVSAKTRNSQSSVQADGKVQFLVNKMMTENHVNIVGEGLVGRAAFTGIHQWVLSDNYFGEGRPPEVLKEVGQQFSAGMQTVAVIPVLPHGVVQFGSYKTIMENMGFVNDVTSLVLQLGHVPGVLLTENYAVKEVDQEIGIHSMDPFLESDAIGGSSFCNNFNSVGTSAPSYLFDSQTSHSLTKVFENDMHSNIAAFHSSNFSPSNLNSHDCCLDGKRVSTAKSDFSPPNQLNNGAAKAEVIRSSSQMLMNQHASLYIPKSNQDFSSCDSLTLDQSMVRHTGPSPSTSILMSTPRNNYGIVCGSNDGSFTHPSVEVNGRYKGISKMEDSYPDSINLLMRNSSFAYNQNSDMEKKFAQNEFGAHSKVVKQNTIKAHDISPSQPNEHPSFPSSVQEDTKQKYGIQMQSMNNNDDSCAQLQSGDDLFDILGYDFKNKLFNSINESASSMHDSENYHFLARNSLASSDIYSTSQGDSGSGMFSMNSTDHLLDAVVSKIQPSPTQNMGKNVSCKTTLSNMSSSSAPSTSLPYGRFGVSDEMKEELFGVPKYMAKSGEMSSCSMRTGTSKEDSGTYSQGSSIYGSQISSWGEKRQSMKQSQSQSQSVSTGYSKKPDETGKTGRKRLKPGENPRPRPKDRQMIQDRVKELREIVPNGAKCSIDALLERTIKHMLFLQSVTKHADKLKQTGESKIIGKDGGLLLKDNFEGGATWAYEVGSQSMVCPIIVEDLNQPRQMLVEMMCEETGLFLEIADIIRGLGLTILKGIMETRNDKIWARFAVEANRDVTRMEIFLSLVRLLEQTAKTNASQTNDYSSENAALQQLQQAAFVPVTRSQ